jgi:cellulose synthase operon protein B
MLLSKLIKYPMKNRFFPAKHVSKVNRHGWSWRSMRWLMLCGMGVLTSLAVVLSSSNPLPAVARPVSVTPVMVAQAATEVPTDAPGIPPREGAVGNDDGRRSSAAPAKEELLSGLNKYILEFNRSPAMGNRFRMEGVYGESRLGFTRPRNWQVKGVKAIIHFQHSPALVASRSNLVIRVNDTSIGTVPLNLQPGQIGEAIVTIPPQLIQDFNDIALVAQQENSPNCSKPEDKTLWTEVLPDSKLVFDYQTKIIPLDFARYPYPFFDDLALDTIRLNYLQPTQVDAAWLTATSRLQTQMGRLADFRGLDTQLLKEPKNLSWTDRLVIVGTPDQQPLLKTLKLPLAVKGDQFVGRDGAAIPADEGLLMMASIEEGKVPVLVVSGNSPEAVQKAAQSLINAQSSKLGSSALIQVKGDLPPVTKIERRSWPRFLPGQKQFQLKDLQGADGKNYKDVTVHGSDAPPAEFNFWALPDDRFLRGNTMTLRYSYSAQADPRKSTVSIAIDDVTIGSKKLDSDQGATNQSFTVDLPENLIKPTSQIKVNFKLEPKDEGGSDRACGRLTDQQLSGTVLADTEFTVSREIGADLPNLKLLTSGYPLADMQDLSRMAIVVPDAPTPSDLMTMLKFSERMGRLSRATSVEHQVYLGGGLTQTVKDNKHIVAIGTSTQFPLPEVFQQGLSLVDSVNRQFGKTQLRTLPNADGVIKSMISPWNKERLVLALTGQTEQGLKQVQDVLGADPWFYQLQGDTALMTATTANPSPYDPNGYQFQFLQESAPQTLENLNPLNKVRRFLQSHFYLLPIGIIAVSLLMYGIAQRYLKRVAEGQLNDSN